MAILLLLLFLLRLCSSTSSLIPRSLIADSSNSSALAQDLNTLLRIKSSLNLLNSSGSVSSDLSDWTPDSASPCSWARIGCTNISSEARVDVVDLSGFNISGSLVQGFSNLTALSKLNLSHNFFQGSTTQDLANCTQLTSLDLSFNNFSAVAPGGFSRLSNLQVFAFASNFLQGSVTLALPDDCAQLRYLNLSSNALQEMSSYAWQNCSSLQVLDLSHNRLVDIISSSITSLPSLKLLQLRNNNLSGSVPDSFCSAAAAPLLSLDLSENNLTGAFPLSTTSCSWLKLLDLSSNRFTGIIPAQMGNLSSLEIVNLSENMFSGTVPSQIGQLVGLQVLMAGSNNLSGALPSELRNCKNLTLLDLNTNRFDGSLPDFFGEMPSLRFLVIHSNAFSGSIPLSMLGLSDLRFLDLSNNTLNGSLPIQLANLSSLQFLMVANNNFSGPIPPELGNVASLQFLDLSSNQLDGSIPPSLGNLNDLLWLMLAFNRLTGPIPRELGNCSSLLWFNVRSNRLSGELPKELASMAQNPQKTFNLNAEKNKISPPTALGECLMIKRWVPEDYPPFNFTYDILNRDSCRTFWIRLLTGSPLPLSCRNYSLSGYFQITDNLFSGSLPDTFQGNRSAILLLGVNRFTGSLPGGYDQLPVMYLNVSHNNLSGPIPGALGNSYCLSLLDMSYNNLSGSIPESLVGLAQLTRFNVSYNPLLSGSVPAGGQFSTFNYYSYTNNSLLCFQRLPGMRENASSSLVHICDSSNSTESAPLVAVSSDKLSHRSALAIGFSACLGIVLFGAMGFFVISKWPVSSAQRQFLSFNQEKMPTWESVSSRESSSTRWVFRGRASSPLQRQLTYGYILMATNNFDESNVIGRGGFGVVYRADLPDGSTVAVKKLEDCGVQGEREFMAEMETLGNHVHENLVPLLACCVFGSERLLVYKFLSNGSLDDWLHEKQDGGRMLSWLRRLRIACGCAKGLRYLHHNCSPVLIHRDMKASNILLDEDFEGYVTDFGLAREMDPGNTHVSTMIAGTLGYVPPEYSQCWRATTKGDVYSFGVVLLELITGRRPVCPMECNNEHVVDWVKFLWGQSRAAEAYDPIVKQTAGESEASAVELLKFLQLALACTEELPEHRPSMQEVAQALEKIQERRLASDLKAGTENDMLLRQ